MIIALTFYSVSHIKCIYIFHKCVPIKHLGTVNKELKNGPNTSVVEMNAITKKKKKSLLNNEFIPCIAKNI